MKVFLSNFVNNFSRKKKLLFLFISDLFIFFLSHIISNYLREEIIWYSYNFYSYIFLFSLLATFISLYFFDIYQNFLRYTNLKIINQIFYSCLLYLVLFFSFLFYFNFYNFPRSIGIIQPIIFFLLIVILRINLKNFYLYIHTNNKKINSIIFGAGSAGIKTVDILYNYNIVALIDDDKEKQGRKYGKIPIISRTEASKFINRYNIQNLYLAVPSQNVLSQRKLLEELKELKIQINILPNINQIDSKNISFIDFENINTNELLERKIFDHNNINKKYYNNKNILITGGGGSIGSEICRQLIDSDFKKLIIYDHSELNMYNIKKEIEDYLKNQKISKNIFYIVGSITDKLQIESVFISHKINIIFHAAAYKHVNLVEDNILSASINNIIGTYNLCDYANKLKIEKFIFISSDKAVRPTNVMGATKRIAEKIIYLFSVNSKTTFCSVRFGNVMGSSGSVIPMFKYQIKNGLPLTVTSKDVTRYFMTISEAVGLVLQSGINSKGGETFILNMGEPIKIYNLAKKMIELSVNNHYQNIDRKFNIDIIGLKKGEKMHEELTIDNEFIPSTEENIFIDNSNNKIILSEPEYFIKKYSDCLNKYDIENLINLFEKDVEGFKFI